MAAVHRRRRRVGHAAKRTRELSSPSCLWVRMAQSAVSCATITIAFNGAILNCKYSLCCGESHCHNFQCAFNKRQVAGHDSITRFND